MKLDRIETLGRKGKNIVIYSSLFGLCQTVFFLGLEGWHLFPQSTAEKICDVVFIVSILIGLATAGYAFFHAVIALTKEAGFVNKMYELHGLKTNGQNHKEK